MEINKDNTNKRRLGRGIGSLLGGDDSGASEFTSNTQNNRPMASQPDKSTVNDSHAAKPNQTVHQAVSPLAATVASPNKITTNSAPAAAVPVVENNIERVWQISIDKLVPGLYQPRKHFNKETLQELADSIKTNGIIQPITVRKRKEGGYEILAGERRWRAAQMANLHEVPAIIKTLTDREALQIALIENIQREDLDPIEEAESYQRLIEEFGLSQQEASEKVGKERSSVANALRLLSLPIEIKDMLALKQVSVGHAKVLLGVLGREEQISLAKKVYQNQLSVRALEVEAKKSTKQNEKSISTTIENNKENLATRLANELADQLQKALGTKVEIPYKNGKGQIVLHYYSDDQLTTIFEKLKG